MGKKSHFGNKIWKQTELFLEKERKEGALSYMFYLLNVIIPFAVRIPLPDLILWHSFLCCIY
jgi:hypothetical protein